ncbi:hypothetical protein CSKR_110747 [Clonorchis sinensis]|uniref:Ig-like domain-containing protein n=1 Tax=Clonorchis sinensis TaxID=79923 RepID=A0A8T1LZI2_CLOSI|nr:hypothetical protein CSKR_110747 [Clonorchis sinensis]
MSAIILAIVILHHFDSADSARGVVAVKFDHPDGILHVGNKTEITCTTQEGENGATGGQLAIRDLNSRTDLISIETSAHKIRPPTPGPTYTKYGSTSVECKYEPNPSNLSNLLQTLTVRILPNPMDGTLDGENSGNLEVTSGSTKEFQCNLVPLDAAKSLNGKWKATVDPAEAATVTGLEDGSSVKTGPPNSQGYQNQWSSFTVSCTFSTPEGTPIYTFERTVAVKRVESSVVLKNAMFGTSCPGLSDMRRTSVETLSVCVINEQVLKLASMSTSNYDPMEVGGANRSTSVCGHGQSPLSLRQFNSNDILL